MTQPVSNDMSHIAEARSRVYELLASVYNRLPDSDFITMLMKHDVLSLLTYATSDYTASDLQREELEQGIQALELFQKQAGEANRDEMITRLGVDRTRLYRGLKRGYGPPPPYESVYQGSHTVMAESALQVKNVYSDCGYRPPPIGNEPPDYIGIEIDFLRFLCREEASSWRSQDKNKAQEYMNKEYDFLNNHVVSWIPRFCAEALTHAKEDFYRGISRLTSAYVVLDAERLQRLITKDTHG
ncbi:MAG: molecular chaperone TorD family protein [Dehalococcoidia bacterium]|nr:MAG: molecular chaperone TorD family protein [Dehalococcoidia bacterium]